MYELVLPGRKAQTSMQCFGHLSKEIAWGITNKLWKAFFPRESDVDVSERIAFEHEQWPQILSENLSEIRRRWVEHFQIWLEFIIINVAT